MNTIKCALCDSSNSNLILKSRDHRFDLRDDVFALVECTDCGLTFLNPQPSQEILSKFYPDRGYYNGKKTLSSYYDLILRNSKIRKIAKHTEKRLVLDVGCGDGSLLAAMERKGWQCYGTDVSKSAYDIAKKRFKNVYLGQLRDCNFETEKFDVVMFNHSFEHLLDPKAELKETKRILKPGGLLYLSVPNFGSMQFKLAGEFWHHLEIPRHTYQYTPATIQSLLQKNGYEIIAIELPMFDFPLDLLHSLRVKWRKTGFKIKEVFYLLPLIKLSPRWRSGLEIIAKK